MKTNTLVRSCGLTRILVAMLAAFLAASGAKAVIVDFSFAGYVRSIGSGTDLSIEVNSPVWGSFQVDLDHYYSDLNNWRNFQASNFVAHFGGVELQQDLFVFTAVDRAFSPGSNEQFKFELHSTPVTYEYDGVTLTSSGLQGTLSGGYAPEYVPFSLLWTEGGPIDFGSAMPFASSLESYLPSAATNYFSLRYNIDDSTTADAMLTSFSVTAVPEPATWAAIVGAAALLAAGLVRRGRAAAVIRGE